MTTYLQTAIEDALAAPAAKVPESPIRGSTGIVSEDSAKVYAAPDESAAVIATLPHDKSMPLLASAGKFFAIEVDGKRGYIKRDDIGEAQDFIPREKQAEWDSRMADAAKKIDSAGHKQVDRAPRAPGRAPVERGIGFPQTFMDLQRKLSLTVEWTDAEEYAQHVLHSYANWYFREWWQEAAPPNVDHFFGYIGRSNVNAAAAAAGKFKSVADLGGGKTTRNWCSDATTRSVLAGLAGLGLAPVSKGDFLDPGTRKLNGQPLRLYEKQAYGARLLPGDLVMYLYDGCQYGGHTVTVVEDMGDAFTHVSGNTGDATGVAIGEARRMKTPPSGFNLTGATKTKTDADKAASTAYIARFDLGGAKLVYSIIRFGAIFAELAKRGSLSASDRAKLLASVGVKEVAPAAPPAKAKSFAVGEYTQTAIEEAAAVAIAASGGSPKPAPAPAPAPPVAPPPPPSPDAKATADVIKVRDYIKGQAQVRAKMSRSVPTSSNFYKRLATFYLKDYLAKPSAALGKKACVDKIGKTFKGPVTGGDRWEQGALDFWNKQPIPEFARKIRPKLPAELAAATDILSVKNRAFLNYIDVPQLVGKPNTGIAFDDDVEGGGKNISQLMHWGTGVKYSDIDKLTMRELFFAYEMWHLEAWDVFGEDPINDQIAEESGRILGAQLRAGTVTKANLQSTLDDAFAEARAWVGTLLKARQSELDNWIVAKTQKKANIWYGAQPEMDVWKSDTLYQMLLSGKSIDDVKKSSFAERIIDIYTLVYETDEWQKAHAPIDNGTFIPQMLSGSMNWVFERMAKGQPVISFEAMQPGERALAQAAEAPIEDYKSDPTGTACAKGPQPGAQALVRELGSRFGGRGEIFNCRPVRGGSRLSLHGEGRAVDWYRRASDPAEAAEAQKIIDWLLASDADGNQHALARRMGVQELIWNRRIWTARRHGEGWRDYTGVNPHTDHLHIGLCWDGARMKTSHWAGQTATSQSGSTPAPAPVPAPAPAGPVTFGNATEIDDWFRAKTGKPFLEWFQDTQGGKGAWAKRSIKVRTDAQKRFTQVWNRIPELFDSSRITLEQFVALQSIFINEVGDTMAPITEGMGTKEHPGMSYLFDKFGTKASYNQAPNKTAYDCFNDPAFIAAHGSLAPGGRLANTTDKAWAGKTYPAGEETSMAKAPFIGQADFCKFRGRGMIQTTWREAYKAVAKFVQAYGGTNAKVLDYKKRWAGMDVEDLLTRSSNADWDDLFQNSDYVIPSAAIKLHNHALNRYLDISADEATRLGKDKGSFHYMGRRISGSGTYGDLFKRRCLQILDAVGATAPAAAPAPAPAPRMPTSFGNGSSLVMAPSGPPPSSSLRWAGATDEQLAFMRRVYDIHVARSARIRKFVANVPDAELDAIEGGAKARTAAAAQCRRLLTDARAALAAAKAGGDAQANSVERVSIVSAYRSVSQQFSGWQGGFPGYYRDTASQRAAEPGGEHSEQAAELLARYIGGILGAPGYSLHNDGRAIDFGTREAGHDLGASKSQRKPWRKSWLFAWLMANAANYEFFQNTSIDEPWHWEHRPAASAGTHGLESGALAVIPGGEADVPVVPLLASHHDAGPDMIIRWNEFAAPPPAVDVVVHLHGFTPDRHMDLRTNKLPISGLDFAPPPPAPGWSAPPHDPWPGRARPTLLVLPRGQARSGHKSAYDFPALVTPGAFADLIAAALAELSGRVGGRIEARRVILTAHSGGGMAVNKILAHTAGTAVDPHEVHCFDSLYGDQSNLAGWVNRRMTKDIKAMGATPPADPTGYMANEGGALRVAYKRSTETNSVDLDAMVKRQIPLHHSFTAALQSHYRVEPVTPGIIHELVAYWYGGRLLADSAAAIPPPHHR